MIALDTNVLVRFLVEDDAAQTAKVTALIEKTISEKETLFISDVVLCETVWVLTSRYGFSRAEVAGVLRELLDADHLSFSAPSQHARALDAFSRGKAISPTMSFVSMGSRSDALPSPRSTRRCSRSRDICRREATVIGLVAHDDACNRGGRLPASCTAGPAQGTIRSWLAAVIDTLT
jgi:predicted nucleic-acid-binding protein